MPTDIATYSASKVRETETPPAVLRETETPPAVLEKS
eukprot:SAG31_NODE_48693_length_173_cov_26.635135_1_plen_36_part_01